MSLLWQLATTILPFMAVAKQRFEVFFINLDRREERRLLIEEEIGNVLPSFDYNRVTAVDAENLTWLLLERMGVRVMENYLMPESWQRPLKMGEVACLLSHHNVWSEIVNKRHNLTMILEDDAEFILEFEDFDFDNFEEDLKLVLNEFDQMGGELLYVFIKIYTSRLTSAVL
ncbi:procollagen galactosyltransferase 1-like isoform X2 [Symsagittifera roscoffensis]|uniref:procollagen galactosyltransferase 1-like isoform X2 n=1 Tax=Symsagittifera roscoffensis TaxID=84072 RepID=UPI00307CA25A